MKYKSLSLFDLLAPILHAATVALGGAIPVHMLFRIENEITFQSIKCIRRFASGRTFYFSDN